MPFWFKFTPDGQTRPLANGPFATVEEAEAAQTDWQQGPPGGPVPQDEGEIVEADENYRSTLPHALARVAVNEVDMIVYSDGTSEPAV